MLKMSLQQRPWAIFDPADKRHRAYFDKFLKTQSWRDCPVQWMIADDSKDVVHYISKILLAYYTSNEFKPKTSELLQKSHRIPEKVP